MIVRALAPLVLLVACATTAQTPSVSQGILLAPDGIRPADNASAVDFGRAQAGAIASATTLMGRAPDETYTNDECGAGSVTTARWSNELMLNFLNGQFLGWVASGSDLRTIGGLTPGQSAEGRAALGVDDYEETSLGVEFAHEDIFGLLAEPSQSADTDILWAGVTCFFR